MSQPSFQMSADARLIYQRLRKAAPDEVVPYADLVAEVSRPLDEIRGAIATAVRRLLRDDGRVFTNVRTVGLKRCTDTQIVDAATGDTDAIRRRARRGVERLTKVVDYASLPPAHQVEHTARMSVLGAIAMFARETSVERVRAASQGRASELPIAETVQAFLRPATATRTDGAL